jgi:hypothetical protein
VARTNIQNLNMHQSMPTAYYTRILVSWLNISNSAGKLFLGILADDGSHRKEIYLVFSLVSKWPSKELSDLQIGRMIFLYTEDAPPTPADFSKSQV